MLTRNIDLTENRDFSGGFQITAAMNTPIELSEADNIMTLEDYDKIIRRESIFGKKRHTNGKHHIFGRTTFVKNLESHCYKCGKELKLPWERNRMELCKQCSDKVKHDNQYLKFPWNYISIIRTDDLFNLR